jgi:hypothetical protein
MCLDTKFGQFDTAYTSRDMFLLFLSYDTTYFGLLLGQQCIFSFFLIIFQHWALLLDFSVLRENIF